MPYWRLSGFYFFYFASLGALVPYWGLYLKSLGFTAAAIGSMMAIIMATKIISPNIWGWVADHTGKRMAIVRLGGLLSLLAFAGVFISQHYWWLVIVMMVFSFFWNATLPQFEATTFSYLGDQTHRYSSVRLWGSIGFIVAVWLIGQQLDGDKITYLPMILMGLFISIWVSSHAVPDEAAGHLHLSHEPLRNILKRPEVTGLLVICFLMQMGHGPYYTFYSIYMQDNGYSLSFIGFLWALGVLAEVVIFMRMHKLVPRFGLKRLLITSLLLAAGRWLMIAYFPVNTPLMIAAQLLHAASFGVYHAVSIQLIHHYFVGKHQGKGQALYSSVSFGAGGAIGSLYAGYSWESFGTTTTFIGACVVSLIAAYIAYKKIPA
ncbi:MAG: MFS transporter [Gammaproteobacteria bacterium]|nr:MFS transporter [Gammaproteobacteria bacterium]